MPESASRPGGRGRASRISISIPSELLDQLRVLSRAEGRSLSNLCALILQDSIDGRSDKP